MTIKDLFQPISPEKFDEFVLLLESTQPDFDEETEWDGLSKIEQSGIILQFSIISEIGIIELTKQISLI